MAITVPCFLPLCVGVFEGCAARRLEGELRPIVVLNPHFPRGELERERERERKRERG